jgi:prepilin-type N-terminal cleavage/methylation domain-containing protein
MKRGFSLIELVTGLAIGAILLLMIAAISNIGNNSYQALRKEAAVYDDIFFGFNLIKQCVRKASAISIEKNWPDPPWKSEILIVDNSAFGLYQEGENQRIDFVYLKDRTEPTDRDIILTGAQTPTLDFSQDGRLITVNLKGEKDRVRFDLSTAVMRRE